MSASETIAVVVVNHNTADLLERCLDSVVADGATSIVVVDHASADGSVDRVRRRFPDVDVRAFDDNPGYGAGVNRGIAATDTPWTLVLNSDTEVRPGCLAALADHAVAHPEDAVLGPRVQSPDGSVQRSCYPEPTVFQLALQDLGLLPVIGRIPALARRHPHTRPHTEGRTAAWLLGAALCIRRDSWLDLGGFDERYGMYFEEVDFCRRVRDAGSQVRLVPDAGVVHVGGASTDAYREALARRYFASRSRYHRLHHGNASHTLLRVETAAVALAQWTRERVRLARGSGDAARAHTFALVARDALGGWRTEHPWTG